MFNAMSTSAVRATYWMLAAAVVTLATPASVSAQNWSERVLISVNGAFQPTKNAFTDRFEFQRNLETGRTEVDYPVEGGFVFDGGVGFRLAGNFGVGVAVSYFTHDDTAATTSQFPHPFFFNQPREVTGDASGITRTE